MMKENQDIERLSYISEMNEILKILKDIPPENVIDRVTFEGRLNKIVQEYREKYFEKTLKNLPYLNPMLLGYMEDEEGVDCCDVCSNEKVACTCIDDDMQDAICTTYGK